MAATDSRLQPLNENNAVRKRSTLIKKTHDARERVSKMKETTPYMYLVVLQTCFCLYAQDKERGN